MLLQKKQNYLRIPDTHRIAVKRIAKSLLWTENTPQINFWVPYIATSISHSKVFSFFKLSFRQKPFKR